MADEIKTEEILTAAPESVAGVVSKAPAAPRGKGAGFQKRTPNKFGRRSGGRAERQKPEFDQKILSIRRVARVAAGGRRFNFSVALVVGNRKGSVGVGTGKAADTAAAIDKAYKNAKKNLFRIPLADTFSIPHEVAAKYSSARVKLFPSPGRGLVAGSAARDVLELGGTRDVVSKIFSGSKNKLNIARATVKALGELASARQ